MKTKPNMLASSPPSTARELCAMAEATAPTIAASSPSVAATASLNEARCLVSFLAVDTIHDFLDTAPLPPGASALWKYKTIYRLNDEQVGQWSDVASTSVIG